MNFFMVKDGECLADAYARFDALYVKIKDIGCEKFQYDFYLNDETIKSKIVSMVVSDDKKNWPSTCNSLMLKAISPRMILAHTLLSQRTLPNKGRRSKNELYHGILP
jgi:hypothetical protein